MKAASRPRRRGLSLIELLVSMTAASALVAGTASTLYVAVRASDPKYAPSVSVLEASSGVADMVMDLQYALSVTSATSTGVTVTVPDRDANASTETIRYAWSGAGQPLTRQYNGGTVANVIPSVQSVAFEYQPSSAAPKTIVLQIQSATFAASAVETYVRLYNLQ
jgi:prepilin-type N-terminal cleavage/methylation domain-containing protein